MGFGSRGYSFHSSSALRAACGPEPPPVATNVRINELDSDTPGADAAEFVELYDGGVGGTHLDGLTVSWPDRWFNVRPSNTEPLLRLNVEGPDPAVVAEIVAKVKSAIEG